MPRHAPELECSAEVKASLVALTKARTVEARAVERARIILASLEGKEIQQVARELKVSVPTVSKWRQRFSVFGVRGLYDQPRSGKPVRYDTAFRNRVLATLEEPAPPDMSHWDGPAVAAKLDASVHAVWRVLRREGIYLQRRRSWCVSTDKEFGPKAADVVGLYLNPPVNALVLSVDEKPSIQAIERTSGYVETDSGKVVRGLKSTYKRHGTLNLFAALEVGTGQVKTKFTEYKSGRTFAVSLMECWPISRTGRSTSFLITTLPTKATTTGWRSSTDASIFISRRLRPVGSTRLKSYSACCNAGHSTEEALKPKISCARPLKPSSEDTTSTPNRSAGGNARLGAASSRIQLLTYAIKH